MSGFRLRERARADLQSIGRYTHRVWGREQRNRYLAQLDVAFRLLADEPQRGRACDDVRPGYRKYRVGRHLIFYREDAEGIDILRVLHDRMDITSRLTDA